MVARTRASKPKSAEPDNAAQPPVSHPAPLTEIERAMCDAVRQHVGDAAFNANPALVKFAQTVAAADRPAQLRMAVFFGLIGARTISPDYMPSVVYTEMVNAGLQTYAWAVRHQLIDILKAQVQQKKIIDEAVLDQCTVDCNAHMDNCVGAFLSYVQATMNMPQTEHPPSGKPN